MPTIRALIEEVLPDAIAFRHDLHRHPELAYQEFRTSTKVREWLDKSGVPYRAGLAKGTGTLGYLPATTDPERARTVALRADMDALPIVEENCFEYRSEYEGLMHACGHDGHTTVLATTARVLAKLPERPQNVLFMFQPAEEGGAGAKRMIAEGALRGEGIGRPAEAVYGMHCFPGAPAGKISTRIGPIMAAATQFTIHVQGKGSHAAYPHLGIDSIVVAAHILIALQTIPSRFVNPQEPVVVTIGKLTAGVAHNVISAEAHLEGTFRTLDDELEANVRVAVERIATHVAAAHGATATVTFAADCYPATINHPEATERLRAIARETLGPDRVLDERYSSMAAEDFSFYGRELPACFFFLGMIHRGQSSFPSLHAATFDFNDDALSTGVETMVNLALRG